MIQRYQTLNRRKGGGFANKEGSTFQLYQIIAGVCLLPREIHLHSSLICFETCVGLLCSTMQNGAWYTQQLASVVQRSRPHGNNLLHLQLFKRGSCWRELDAMAGRPAIYCVVHCTTSSVTHSWEIRLSSSTFVFRSIWKPGSQARICFSHCHLVAQMCVNTLNNFHCWPR